MMSVVRNESAPAAAVYEDAPVRVHVMSPCVHNHGECRAGAGSGEVT